LQRVSSESEVRCTQLASRLLFLIQAKQESAACNHTSKRGDSHEGFICFGRVRFSQTGQRRGSAIEPVCQRLQEIPRGDAAFAQRHRGLMFTGSASKKHCDTARFLEASLNLVQPPVRLTRMILLSQLRP
jgi:hypothetical protein